MRLEGKVAIITGGAHGMGAAEARLFAREGAKVAIADIREEDGRKIEAEIAKFGGKAIFVALDVSQEDQWQSAVAQVVNQFGKLDILVNNAGISGSGDPSSTETWDRLMNINAKGVFLGMKYAISRMQVVGGGSIVNISSISGFVGQEVCHPGYNASKGAVRLVTKAAAVQHAKDGIRVNSVHPGLMPPMLNTAVQRGDSALENLARENLVAAVPMRREGAPEEVANAVLFLASDEASYITGTELIVDGGFTAK
jgi:3(or 17)beta-hydroxysteroid dehydrogenase